MARRNEYWYILVYSIFYRKVIDSATNGSGGGTGGNFIYRFLCLEKLVVFSKFSDVIIKWRLNGLTTNVKTLKLVPMDSQWLITPRIIQFMAIGGIV